MSKNNHECLGYDALTCEVLDPIHFVYVLCDNVYCYNGTTIQSLRAANKLKEPPFFIDEASEDTMKQVHQFMIASGLEKSDRESVCMHTQRNHQVQCCCYKVTKGRRKELIENAGICIGGTIAAVVVLALCVLLVAAAGNSDGGGSSSSPPICICHDSSSHSSSSDDCHCCCGTQSCGAGNYPDDQDSELCTPTCDRFFCNKTFWTCSCCQKKPKTLQQKCFTSECKSVSETCETV